MPDTSIASSYITDTISITAAPNEFEPATFVVKANTDIASFLPEATSLTGTAGTISSSYIDIKVVKVWHQKGYSHTDSDTGYIYTQSSGLTSELLLNDDFLVNVVGDDDYLKVNGEYILINDPDGIEGISSQPTTDEFPVQDASTLQSTSITSGSNKQYWITIEIPSGTVGGTYTGSIYLKNGGATLRTLTLNVDVLDTELPADPMTHSIYYTGYVTTTGKIFSSYKNETQFRAEMTDLYKHGVINPSVYDNNTSTLAQALTYRQDAGMSNQTLYYLGIVIGSYGDMDVLKALVTSTLEFMSPYGVSDLYVYATDEASLNTESMRNQIAAVHEIGSKVFDAQTKTQANSVADVLDLATVSYVPSSTLATAYHNNGHKIFSYADPFVAFEKPETFRRNYGLSLWQNGYDGTMNWAYQSGVNNIWNDFDYATSNDFVFAYPTVNGVIDTLQWEGMREAVDDVKYVTLLQNLIATNKASGAKPTQNAENWVANMQETDLEQKNLNTVRSEIIAYIKYFLGDGADVICARCGSSVVEEPYEDCDGSDLNNKTCADFSYTGGTLACRSDCYFDKSSCTPARLNLTYATSTDFSGGYLNRTYADAKVAVDTSYDASAWFDLTGSDKSLIMYFNFQEINDSTVEDISGTGKSGTLKSGVYETLDTGTTENSGKETSTYALGYANDAFNNWTFEATSGAANGETTLISDYVVNNLMNDKDIILSSSLTGLATGDTYHIYKNTSYPTSVTGKFGNGISFDGIDDYIQINNLSLYNKETMTFSAWIKPAIISGTQYFFSMAGPLSLGLVNDKLYSAFQTLEESTGAMNGDIDIPVNTWTHVATTYDGTTFKTYINGVLDELHTFTQQDVHIYGDGCAQLGRGNNGNCNYGAGPYFQGLIDEVMMFSRALSVNEIKSLYSSSAYPNLIYRSGTLAEGDHNFIAYAINALGTTTQTATRTVHVAPAGAGDIDLSSRGLTLPFKLKSGSAWDMMTVDTSSTFNVKISDANNVKIDYGSNTLFDFTPSGGEIFHVFDTAYLTDGYPTRWTVSSSVPTANVAQTIKAAKNSTYYAISVDGTHLGSYQSDSSGNVSFTYNSGFSTKEFTLEEDTTPPSVFTLSSPVSNSIIGGLSADFIWTSPGNPDIDKFSFYLDGILNQDDFSSTTLYYTPVSTLPCGEHTWFIKAHDLAGNIRQSATSTLTFPCSNYTSGSSNLPVFYSTSSFKVAISGDKSKTTTSTVEMILGASKEFVKMAISNFSDFKDAILEPFKTKKIWKLIEEAGTKIIYAKFCDQSLNCYSIESDTILYEPAPTSTLSTSTTTLDAEEMSATTTEKQVPTTDVIIGIIKDNEEKQAENILPLEIVKNLNPGAKGEEVKKLQDKLKEMKYLSKKIKSTGYFGSETKEAVKQFQKSVGIYPNGIVGPRTRKALSNLEFITNKDFQFIKDIKQGDKNEDVKQLQTRLKDTNFFPYNVNSTGYFGSITKQAVIIFQKFFNLIQTGIVDTMMRKRLNGG
ncbi:MAG: peptidoglycan-binding protein [Patescibacteria group bacterium]|nr:peptidoglycan-binding protein [Patescibacteria group bacterium]